jgi:hypothetical protein
MIVLSSRTASPSEGGMSENKEHHETYVDLFRKELDAYCAYKDWSEETDDTMLEMALEEIMYDEYLHAKFLRDYLIDHGMYTLTDADPHEKKFWKIHKKLFER